MFKHFKYGDMLKDALLSTVKKEDDITLPKIVDISGKVLPEDVPPLMGDTDRPIYYVTVSPNATDVVACHVLEPNTHVHFSGVLATGMSMDEIVNYILEKMPETDEITRVAIIAELNHVMSGTSNIQSTVSIDDDVRITDNNGPKHFLIR